MFGSKKGTPDEATKRRAVPRPVTPNQLDWSLPAGSAIFVGELPHWTPSNMENGQYYRLGRQAIVLNPNPTSLSRPAVATEATILGLRGQDRFVTRLENPFEKASPITFNVKLMSMQGQILGEQSRSVIGGAVELLDIRLSVPATGISLRLSTSVAPPRTTDWAWGVFVHPCFASAQTAPDYAKLPRYQPG